MLLCSSAFRVSDPRDCVWTPGRSPVTHPHFFRLLADPFHAPGVTDGGKHTMSYSNHIDLMPTLAEVAIGMEMPPCPTGKAIVDNVFCTMGKSLAPILRNASAVVNQAAFSQYPRGSPPHSATLALEQVNSTPSPSLCLHKACIMGYSVITFINGNEWRYTEWVEFNGEIANSMAWDKNYGTELYDMTHGKGCGYLTVSFYFSTFLSSPPSSQHPVYCRLLRMATEGPEPSNNYAGHPNVTDVQVCHGALLSYPRSSRRLLSPLRCLILSSFHAGRTSDDAPRRPSTQRMGTLCTRGALIINCPGRAHPPCSSAVIYGLLCYSVGLIFGKCYLKDILVVACKVYLNGRGQNGEKAKVTGSESSHILLAIPSPPPSIPHFSSTKQHTSTPSRTDSGSSTQSVRFPSGRIMCVTPERLAASIFSLIPPTRRTLPVNDNSPVMARFSRTGLSIASDMRAVTMVQPAEGPSFGVAPSGT